MKEGVVGVASVTGATGVGAIGVGVTGATAVVAQGDVEGVERARLNHMLRATRFVINRLPRSKGLCNCFYRGIVG